MGNLIIALLQFNTLPTPTSTAVKIIELIVKKAEYRDCDMRCKRYSQLTLCCDLEVHASWRDGSRTNRRCRKVS